MGLPPPEGAMEGKDKHTISEPSPRPSHGLSLRARRGVTIRDLQPTTPTTLEEQRRPAASGPCDPPVTPKAQLILSPATPMAPARVTIRKRGAAALQDEDQLHDHLGRDFSPKTPEMPTEEFTPAPTPTLPFSQPHFHRAAPQSTLKEHGLAVFSSSFKHNHHKSQALVNMIECDASRMQQLECLVERGRLFGGAPSYSFTHGRTLIRYVYVSAYDVEYQAVAETRPPSPPLSNDQDDSESLWLVATARNLYGSETC